MATKQADRCWPGYEPVPGKPQHSEGSCKKKPESKIAPAEKKFTAKRKRQLDEWQREHPGSPRKAAQHLSAPGSARKAKATTKSATPRKGAAKRSSKRKTT